jgi:4-hydroxy-tetrahydrodipicolinate synthase
MTDLAGVIPITATPFHSDGRVDEDSIVSLVEFEARCGVHGLNVLGIMGEFRKLTESERRRVAEVFIRPPGPSLDDVTRAELRAILERNKLLTA